MGDADSLPEQDADRLRQQLASLHAISVEIAGLHRLADIHERALGYCLALTDSEFAFIGLLRGPGIGIRAGGTVEPSERVMEVAAIRGFEADPEFYELFHHMALRSSVVGLPLIQHRSYISNDVLADPHHVGQPRGHPPIRKFLGVVLRIGERLIGMIGVANKPAGYAAADEQLLSTFANQVAVAVDNARLYEQQRQMIAELQQLQERLTEADRLRLLAQERDRIAGHLHDRIEQQIFAIGLRLNTLLDQPGADPELVDRVRDIRQLAVATSGEVRKAIFAVASPSTGLTDLSAELASLLLDLESSSGIGTHLSIRGSPASGVEELQGLIHSVVQEALTNIAKHAHAGMVLVSLRYEDDRVDAVIQDDGVGIPEIVLRSFEDSHLHFGLRHMRQAVIQQRGSFEVARGEEAGTVIRVSIPLHPEQS